jgi:hypothetical protein
MNFRLLERSEVDRPRRRAMPANLGYADIILTSSAERSIHHL